MLEWTKDSYSYTLNYTDSLDYFFIYEGQRRPPYKKHVNTLFSGVVTEKLEEIRLFRKALTENKADHQ